MRLLTLSRSNMCIHLRVNLIQFCLKTFVPARKAIPMIRKVSFSFFTAMLVTSFFLSHASAQQQFAPADNVIVERLDNILERLERIELRLATMDAGRNLASAMRVDMSTGMLKNAAGRKIGFWGMDGIPTTIFR